MNRQPRIIRHVRKPSSMKSKEWRGDKDNTVKGISTMKENLKKKSESSEVQKDTTSCFHKARTGCYENGPEDEK